MAIFMKRRRRTWGFERYGFGPWVDAATEYATSRDVAATIARYDLLAVPVVDAAGNMLGIVTVDDAIDAIMPEDLAKELPRITPPRRTSRLQGKG